MPARILLFFEYGTLSGGELSMLTMLEELGKTDLEFVAAAPASGMLAERLKQCGLDVLQLALADAQGQRRTAHDIASHLVDTITRVRPDLVHSNSLSMGRMVGRIAPQLSIPCTSHLRDIIRLSRQAVRDLNRNAGLVAVSNATKQFHLEQGVSAEKVHVIYNDVDTEVFRPGPATGSLKRELGLGRDALLCANIGQICLRKGQTLLALAAARLAGEFPRTHYLFVGRRQSGKQESVAYESAIPGIFQEAGIENRLFRFGFRRDIPDILNEVDLLVHTAHQEPLGRVLLEAASSGRPIIATDVGGTREILTDEVSALLVPPDNLEALARAIRRLLTDPTLRIRLGCRARAAVLERFSLPGSTQRLRAFWESLL